MNDIIVESVDVTMKRPLVTGGGTVDSAPLVLPQSRRYRTPVQLGENCWGPSDMRRAIETGACDYFMPDAVKIGGVSGWLSAAAIGESHGVPLSRARIPKT